MTNREHQTLTSSIPLYAAGKGLVYAVLTHDSYVVMMRRLFLFLQNSVSSLPDWLPLCSNWFGGKKSCVVSFSQCWPYITGLLSINTMCVCCCCCCMLIVAISSQVVFQVDWVSVSAQDYSELLGAR